MPPRRTNAGPSTAAGQSTAGSMPFDTKTLEFANKILESNNFWIRDEKAKERYPEVVDIASQLVWRKRHSDMDEGSQRMALEERNDNAFTNEETFVKEMWNHMHKDQRDKRIDGLDDSDIVDKDWTTEFWHKSHLGASWKRDFRLDSVPRLETNDALYFDLLSSLPRVSTPRPDLAYGIKDRVFTQREKAVKLLHLRFVEVSRGIAFPFFAAEFKGAGGNMAEAEVQACRTGGAMVIALRELQKIPGREWKQAGADTSTFTFTLAMSTSQVQLHVHWAEIVPGNQPIYHMHLLHDYSLNRASNYRDIRRVLNNILDWGLKDRLNEGKEILHAIDIMHDKVPPSKRARTSTGPSAREGPEMQ